MITVNLQDFLAIHRANYADNELAHILATKIMGLVGGAMSARVDHLVEFADYCDATEN